MTGESRGSRWLAGLTLAVLACTGDRGESGVTASASGTATSEATTAGTTTSSSGSETTTTSAGTETTTEAALSCPAHAEFDCVTPIGCENPNAPCGGCNDIFGADGCLRPVCNDDDECGSGERCASIPTFLNLMCNEIDGACVCGGDPLNGAIDMCVADDCP